MACFEIKKTTHGNLTVKNGTGEFVMPVIVDGQYRDDMAKVAEEMGVMKTSIFTALGQGTKVGGKEVRRVTKKEIEQHYAGKEKKSFVAYRVLPDDTVETKVRGKWTRAWVAKDGLFLSKNSAGTYRPDLSAATESDILAVHPDAIKCFGTGEDKAEMETPDTDKPFFGVVWPDGSVEVRLTAGGMQPIRRPSKDDLHEEVLQGCHWASW